MPDNENAQPPSGEAAEKPAEKAEAPKAPPEKKPAEPPPPPAAGPIAQFLTAKGLNPTPLGFDATGQEMIDLSPEQLVAAATFLRDSDETAFDLLVCLSGVDWKTHRQVVYHLYATQTAQKVVLKVNTSDDKVPSVVSVWPTADWHEREAYDLFGITFEGHPDLRRILMPVDWIGHPLRKDYQVNDPRLVWNER